jgi:hypothetical protein
MTKPVTPENLLRLGMGFWGSKTFLSAVDATRVTSHPVEWPFRGRNVLDVLDP